MDSFWICLLGVVTLCLYGVGANEVAGQLQIDQLLSRLEVLEKRDLQKDTVIQQLLEEVERQKNRIEKQQEVIDDLKTEVDNLKHAPEKSSNPEVEEEEEDVEALVKQPALLARSGDNNVILPSRRLVLDRAEGPIAFYARIDKYAIEHIGITQKLVFDITVINIGDGYHNSSGIFTAPAPGLYFFSLSVCILHSGKDIHAEIMKNGVNVAGSYAAGYDQGSVSALITLVAGDEVWVSSLHHPDTYLWGDSLTSFMGYMIATY